MAQIRQAEKAGHVFVLLEMCSRDVSSNHFKITNRCNERDLDTNVTCFEFKYICSFDLENLNFS